MTTMFVINDTFTIALQNGKIGSVVTSYSLSHTTHCNCGCTVAMPYHNTWLYCAQQKQAYMLNNLSLPVHAVKVTMSGTRYKLQVSVASVVV